MKKVLKFIFVALAFAGVLTGTAIIFKNSARKIEAGDEEIMFIG